MARKGFTLMELLVVIAIIGVLSTIIIASLDTARENARISSAKDASANLDRAIGSEAVGWWDFDECSGTKAGDESGSNNPLTLMAGVGWSTDTPNGRGCALSFDGTDWAGVADKDIQDVRTGNATRALWFKTAQTTSSYLFKKTDGGDSNGMAIDIGLSFPGQLLCSAKGTGSIARASLPGAYNDNRWHFVACVLDRKANKLTIIVDGSTQASADASFLAGVDMNSSDSTFFPNNLPAYAGLIDGVRMEAVALSLAEVERLYAEGKGAGPAFATAGR